MIRVLIADDSALFRSVLKAGLEIDPEIRVVGQASRADELLVLCERLRPDIITIDAVMPGMDVEEAIKQILSRQSIPVLVITSLKRESILFKMLSAGALDVISKSSISPQTMIAIVKKIKRLAAASPPTPPGTEIKRGKSAHEKESAQSLQKSTPASLIVIASSAGGPPALAELLANLQADLPSGVIIVQHIASGFGKGFANWLNALTPIRVKLAEDGESIPARTALIAPDNAHLIVNSSHRIHLDRSTAPVGTLRPAADYTFRSAASVYRSRLLAVVLTGMGKDGSEGAKAVKACGGRVIVQDRETSAVYGMPAAALPYASESLSLNKISAYITQFAREHTD